MNSVHELYVALQDLCSCYSDFSIEEAANSSSEITGLRTAARHAGTIADGFIGVNEKLEIGWRTVAEFVEKIDKELCSAAFSLVVEINKFVEITKENQEIMNNSIDNLNEETQKILNELGLN